MWGKGEGKVVRTIYDTVFRACALRTGCAGRQIKYYAGKVLERMGAGLSGSLYELIIEARKYGPEYFAQREKTKSAWRHLKVRPSETPSVALRWCGDVTGE